MKPAAAPIAREARGPNLSATMAHDRGRDAETLFYASAHPEPDVDYVLSLLSSPGRSKVRIFQQSPFLYFAATGLTIVVESH